VNIDIGAWAPYIDAFVSKLPKRLTWQSEEDGLRHIRQHVPGMSLPQFYLKVDGCWTGGHEENLRFIAININHGPSDVEWWALDPA
jgi:histone demethylase